MTDKAPASRQLLNITKAALESAEEECLTIRNATIEQCARVADEYAAVAKRSDASHLLVLAAERIAAFIRALKDKP